MLILQRIQDAFPGIELIGGTTNGEISSILEFQQDSLTLMLFASDEVEICAGIGRGASKIQPLQPKKRSPKPRQRVHLYHNCALLSRIV